jgi:hypothetical protein
VLCRNALGLFFDNPVLLGGVLLQIAYQIVDFHKLRPLNEYFAYRQDY